MRLHFTMMYGWTSHRAFYAKKRDKSLAGYVLQAKKLPKSESVSTISTQRWFHQSIGMASPCELRDVIEI